MMRKFATLSIVCMLVPACTTTQVYSQVATIDTLPAAPAAARVAILPLENQAGDLEFRSYAQEIAKRLEAEGFTITSNPAETDMVAFFEFGIGQARDEVFSYPIFGQTGGGFTSYSGTVNSSSGIASYSGTATTTPTYGVVGSGVDTRSVYDRYFKLELVKFDPSEDRDIEVVYRVTVDSTGSSSNFLTVSNCMFDAAFEEFRGTGSRQVVGTDCTMEK